MTTQPPPETHRMTWVDAHHTTWRVEYLTGWWSLSRYEPGTEQWTRVGSYPNRKAAIGAAYGKDSDA